MSKIKIQWATYGTNKNSYIATSRVQQLADLGYDKIDVNNYSFGDPHPGNQKAFAVMFQVGDEAVSVAACLEGQSVLLKTGKNPSCGKN